MLFGHLLSWISLTCRNSIRTVEYAHYFCQPHDRDSLNRKVQRMKSTGIGLKEEKFKYYESNDTEEMDNQYTQMGPKNHSQHHCSQMQAEN